MFVGAECLVDQCKSSIVGQWWILDIGGIRDPSVGRSLERKSAGLVCELHVLLRASSKNNRRRRILRFGGGVEIISQLAN